MIGTRAIKYNNNKTTKYPLSDLNSKVSLFSSQNGKLSTLIQTRRQKIAIFRQKLSNSMPIFSRPKLSNSIFILRPKLANSVPIFRPNFSKSHFQTKPRLFGSHIPYYIAHIGTRWREGYSEYLPLVFWVGPYQLVNILSWYTYMGSWLWIVTNLCGLNTKR